MSVSFRPNLVRYYIDAMRDEYPGTNPWVSQKYYGRFADVEVALMRKGINPHHYAYSMARYWKRWCVEHGMANVPINTFLGKKSLEWYEQYALFGVDVVTPSRMRVIILNDEYILAMNYVLRILDDDPVAESELVKHMSLSEHWHHADAEMRRPMSEVAEVIAKLYGVECLTSNYTDLARVIRGRQIRLESKIS